MAKRISSTSINWKLITDLAAEAPEVRSALLAFKSKTDKLLREIATKPAELPKLDWNYYKSRITTPGLAESFQKSYESLTVPYPSDKGLVAQAEKDIAIGAKKEEEFMKANTEQVTKLKNRLKELEAMLPYSQMSLEEYFIAHPELRLSPENPRFWPAGYPDEKELEERKAAEEKLQAEAQAKLQEATKK